MANLTVGQRVVVTNGGSSFWGERGTVIEVGPKALYSAKIELDRGARAFFNAVELGDEVEFERSQSDVVVAVTHYREHKIVVRNLPLRWEVQKDEVVVFHGRIVTAGAGIIAAINAASARIDDDLDTAEFARRFGQR